jgi:hypothetical protein
VLLTASALLVSSCVAGAQDAPPGTVRTTAPTTAGTVLGDADAAALALSASATLFEESPLVVIAPADDPAAQLLAAAASIPLGVPLLLSPPTPASPTGDSPATGTSSPPPTRASTPRPGGSAATARTSTPVPGSASKPGAAPTSSAPGNGVDAELARLGAARVLAVGETGFEPRDDAVTVVTAEATVASVESATGIRLDPAVGPETSPSPATGDADDPADSDSAPRDPVDVVAGLSTDAAAASGDGVAPVGPRPERAAGLPTTLALVDDDPAALAAAATIRAARAGIRVVADPPADLLDDPAVIDLLHDAGPDTTGVLLVGHGFAAQPAPDWSVRVARTAAQLPGGGLRLFGSHRFVALYGTPGAAVLGVLGEQDVAGTIARAQQVAAQYDHLSDLPVVPTLEIIATVAAGDAGADGDFSNERDVATLEPYVTAAEEAGMAVVLDLQPGRTDFLTQAKLYQSLLEHPNVGLALDPEWRLAADQVPLEQIGSVSAAEVDAVSAWLAELVNSRSLPPKMLVLHQFRSSMIGDRSRLDLAHPELEFLIHVDGQGAQPDKQATWNALHEGAPAGVAWGWKNFYDEDAPMLTPEQTMATVSPVPDFISYQ